MKENIVIVIFIVIGLVWIVGGNYIAYQSFKRRNMPTSNMFHPLVAFKLEGIDYLKILALAIATLIFSALVAVIYEM